MEKITIEKAVENIKYLLDGLISQYKEDKNVEDKEMTLALVLAIEEVISTYGVEKDRLREVLFKKEKETEEKRKFIEKYKEWLRTA